MFALCDFKVFYTEVYVGTESLGSYQQSNSPDAVVERMCDSIRGTRRNVTTDDWFRSFKLIENLSKNLLVDTDRENKKVLKKMFYLY